MTYEAYTVLEVNPQASIETIKQNYARLYRKYLNNEAKISSVLQAHEILVDDPQIKEIYDALQFVGELWKIYEKKYYQKTWEEAIETLMRISVEKPNNDDIENLRRVLQRVDHEITYSIWQEWEKLKDGVYIQYRFGLCYTHTQQWSEAIEAYEHLIDQKDNWKPEDSIYWMGFGQVYRHQAEAFQSESANQPGLYQRSRECFKQAISLDPSNSTPYLSIARTYLKENNYSGATAWAEKAMEADGKLDFDDFEALHFLCVVYASSRDFQKIKEIALKIKPLLPNQEKYSYASSKFTEYANECYQQAIERCDFLEEIDFHAQLDLFKTSASFLEAAAEFSPKNEEIEKQYIETENLMRALNQFQAVKDDPLFPVSYKNLVVLSFSDYMNLGNSDNKTENFLNSLIIEIAALPGVSFTKLTERLSSQYSEVYNLNKKIFYRVAQELSKQQIKALVNKTEPLSIHSYQNFVEAIKNSYFQNSDELKGEIGHATDRLHVLLEPITERILEKYEEVQFNSSNLLNTAGYEDFVEMIRSRAAADSSSVRKGISLTAKHLHDLLDPLAEKIVAKHPGLQRFISPIVKKLSNLSEKIN